MTGFGNSVNENAAIRIKTEIRSLNNKFFELYLKIPKAFKEKEIELRQRLQTVLGRGSVNLSVEVEHKEGSTDTENLRINTGLATSYKEKFQKLESELGVKSTDLFNLVIAQPEVIRFEENDMSMEEWAVIEESIEESLQKLLSFRESEGSKIMGYLEECISRIRTLTITVENNEKERRENIRSKLMASLDESGTSLKFDPNRMEQEMIFYLEKIDIGEEKNRLKNHLDYFEQTLSLEVTGKKLGFITQEIGREINTMGAKANHFPTQQAVVEMKEELEKMKEQLLNVL
jgi:uncharacterized protein (TIGR00255 family)